ncbi:MAG TPA: ATP-binding protein [Leptolyngbyaceae cyanobacterium]
MLFQSLSIGKKFRLRTTLIVPFLLQIIATTGLVGFIVYRSGERTVNAVASQLRNELATRIYEKLASYAEIPHAINRLNASAVTKGNIDILNVKGELAFWQQMQIYPLLSYVYCGDENGAFIGIGYQQSDTLILEYSNSSTNFISQNIALDNQGNRKVKIGTFPKPYDPRLRPWYQAAKATGGATWSEIYLDFTTLFPTLTASIPVYNAVDGSFIGSCATDVFLPRELNKFLQTLKIGKTGTAFIIERSGLLVATSTPEPMTQGNGENTKRLYAEKSTNSVIQSTATYLKTHSQNIGQIQSVQQLEFSLKGERQYVQVVPFQNRNIDWLIVLTIPESDFMTEIHAGQRNALLLSLAALGVSIAVGILTARLITQPILRLTQASQDLAKGNLDRQVENKDVIEIEEIDTLEQSFNSMAAQLKAFFTTLEAQKETLANQNEELQNLDRLKDEFLANTSHELRTPLNGIIGIAESLIDGATGELSTPTQANLQLIVSSGRRLASLINDILDFSKLKHQNLELKLTPVDLRTITQIVLTLSQPLAYQKNLQLINAISEDLPSASADENRLQQILHNLIGNAIKFTPSGRIEISAKLTSPVASPDGKNLLAVTIADTGIGISEDKFDRIFQSFEQAEGATAREYGGTGLGLAVTKQLVELHGGEISVQSQVGIGSQFTFTLPLSQEKAKVVQPPVETIPPSFNSELISLVPLQKAASIANDNQQFKILIVDDEPINRQVLINNLSLHNYTSLEASNGEEALAAIENGFIPDLILLDLMMPRMTGYEVCQKIRERFPAHELPIVMLTAKNQVENIVDGFTSGANDYLAKPIQKQEMLARMKTHLNLAKLTLAYGRFVPRDFLNFLGKESIIDVQIGNQVQQEMTVMFADIRSFTTLSEGMTPQETFNFINAYLSRVSPAIREHQGFIDKYIGDAIMALFPHSADGAVQAAISMQQKVAIFNEERQQKGLETISIGIGLHTGNLMLGTIGESERMETTVIADAVNLASRLEGLTKLYGAEILMSVHTLIRVESIHNYSFRFLDRVRVKGKNNVVAIYELYDESAGLSNQLKTETKSIFEAAVMAYNRQDFVGVQPIFEEIFRKNPEDKAAQIYLKRCHHYLQYGVPEGWDGVTDFDFK